LGVQYSPKINDFESEIGFQIGLQIGPQGPHYCSLNSPPVKGTVMEKVEGTVMQKMEKVKGTVMQKMEKVKGTIMHKNGDS